MTTPADTDPQVLISGKLLDRIATLLANEGFYAEGKELQDGARDQEHAPLLNFKDAWRLAAQQKRATEASESPEIAQEPAIIEAYKLGLKRGRIKGLIRANTICKFKFAGYFPTSKRKVGADSCSHEIEGELIDCSEDLQKFITKLGIACAIEEEEHEQD